MYIFEVMSGPIFVFHGTSQEDWDKPQNQVSPTSLYLTLEPTIARSYAREKANSGLTPIIVKFQFDILMSTLKRMQRSNKIDVINWREALHSDGVFSVYGMIDEIKHLGSVTPISV